jgi:hyperosmotically inducible periplasmic protein
MKLKPYTYALLLALPLSGVIAGCGQSNQGSSSMADTNVMPEDTNGAGTSVTTSTNSADNSAVNVRDRDTNNLTPGDQGTTQGDIDLTQKIRKQLVMNTDYSMNAKNIKIITVNGKVTLRGPVNSDNEKSGIESLAQNIAGNGNVNNQLEVATNSTDMSTNTITSTNAIENSTNQ